jgi:murein DD-endopeptidase MepM/ murein hydrolase activator NlpD
MMLNFFLLLPLISLPACASSGPQKERMSIKPGEVRWVEFPYPGEEAKFTCKGHEVKFTRRGDRAQAVVVESYFSGLEPFKCTVTLKKNETTELEFKIEERNYPAEQLKVQPKTIQLSAKNQKRALEEQLILNEIYKSSAQEALFERPFLPPMQSHVTSVYGTKRVYNKTKAGQHLGIDYRAAIGEKVPTVNNGRVVYAGDLFYTGYTVIVDHGMDIFSVYGHLSKTLVKQGDVVERGQLIGLSGNTGRTSGPHLHWGMKVQGQYIDGFVLVDETKKHLTE